MTVIPITYRHISPWLNARALALFSLLLLAACNDDKPPPQPPGAVSPWSITYSQGMPAHPFGTATNWYFDFPRYDQPLSVCAPDSEHLNCPGVHYVTLPLNTSIVGKGAVSVSIAITTSGAPVFEYKLNPNNTCDNPASTRFMLERVSDDMTHRSWRWFSSPITYTLAPGSGVLKVALTPDQWIDVYGQSGSADPDKFNDVLANFGNLGLVFGGGCFAGHGVNVSGGTARFTLSGYSIQ